MNAEPTDLELLLVLAAGGEVRVPEAMAQDRRTIDWTSERESNGDMVFRARRFVTVNASVRPVDEFHGL